MNLQPVQERIAKLAEQRLAALDVADARLAEAMHYALMNGGKRLRPFLIYATMDALNAPQALADSAAVALEMIHSYSLVHDDLPAMDDDDLRRGKPTCHIAFDEATAILAGDALLNGAYEVLAAAQEVSPQQRLELITVLGRAAGSAGMVGGQAIDILHVGKELTLEQLERMHLHKTGALIRVAVQMGAICAGASDQQTINALDTYARAVGLAFQVQDDILDIEGDTAVLGKQQGADEALNKPTYPALLGLEGARKKAADLVEEAVTSLSGLPGDTSTLEALARYIITRDH
ncbi:MAG: farnesyl diphosphate synthase [Pseudomonadota bacterium]|nr:farnesyl diphosphate synthase [Pseudomonadota bacterium]MEC8104543.1 farnesyl diphosphate synthase [Pseudomonadota bacterium]